MAICKIPALAALVSIAPGAALILLTAVSGQAEAQVPTGQVIGWKHFASDYVNPIQTLPAVPEGQPNPGYVKLNWPLDPSFHKQRDDSYVGCIGGADVWSHNPDDTLAVAIFMSGNNTMEGMLYSQAMPMSSQGFVTFAFSWYREPHMLTSEQPPRDWAMPAGDYEIDLRMASWLGQEAFMSRISGALQCFEVLLPPPQQ